MGATVRVQVTVNGEPRESEVEARTLLVHWLRDELGLTGTHIGCDTTNCGACTVHLNGDAVQELHGARRPGRRRPGDDDRGPGDPTAACIRSRTPSGRSTASSAATARRA